MQKLQFFKTVTRGVFAYNRRYYLREARALVEM